MNQLLIEVGAVLKEIWIWKKQFEEAMSPLSKPFETIVVTIIAIKILPKTGKILERIIDRISN